ncbi:MAG: methionyl-tRNA formyltransferase [Treponema sp.]|nr:methionyl-tRNA formyltransferase [Treponema sp.]
MKEPSGAERPGRALRVLFAASPAIAVPSLQAVSRLELEGRGVALAGLLTNPDSARKRGLAQPTDVSAAAFELDRARRERGLASIPQLKPEKLDLQAREEAAALAPDLLVSFAYGRIFGPRFLALFPRGGINIHPSLLPKYRGAAPIPAAILSGERETGICVQKLAVEMDSGDILARKRIELSGRETTLSLSEAVSHRAAALLDRLLVDFDPAAARPQTGQAVYCSQIRKEDGAIDWARSAVQIDAQIRAYTPWPLSFTELGTDTLFILEARPLEPAAVGAAVPGTVLGTDRENGILIQTGDGVLAVSRLQWQAKKALDWKAFCNGARNFTGARLGGG